MCFNVLKKIIEISSQKVLDKFEDRLKKRKCYMQMIMNGSTIVYHILLDILLASTALAVSISRRII